MTEYSKNYLHLKLLFYNFSLDEYLKIEIKYIKREIQIWSKIKNQRIVEYIKTEVDNNNKLHIHMEYCSDDLKNILLSKHLAFKRAKNDQMSELEYYISCKIFIELLEALSYLHEQQILYRDMKPDNILFTKEGIHSGIFFKLCDFGLAKLYYDGSHTKNVGTWQYMAQEVMSGNYDTKADVYSLSIVTQQLFDINSNFSRKDNLKSNFKLIEHLTEEMIKVDFTTRPTCRDTINNQNKWCLSSRTSTDFSHFSFNDNYKCESLNVYLKYHFTQMKQVSNVTSFSNFSYLEYFLIIFIAFLCIYFIQTFFNSTN